MACAGLLLVLGTSRVICGVGNGIRPKLYSFDPEQLTPNLGEHTQTVERGVYDVNRCLFYLLTYSTGSFVQSDGTRPIGRPKKRWIENDREDCVETRLSLHAADRLVIQGQT